MKNKNPVLLFLTLLLSSLLMIWFTQGSINAYWQQTYHEESPLSRLDQYDGWKKGQYYREQTEALLAQYGLLPVPMNETDMSSDTLSGSMTAPVVVEGTSIVETENVADGAEQDMAQDHSPGTDVMMAFENTRNNGAHTDSFPKNTALSEEEKPLSSIEETTQVAKPQVTLNQVEPPVDSKAEQPSLAVDSVAPSVTKENPPTSEPIKQKMVYLKSGDKVFFAGDSLMQGVAPVVQRLLKDKYKISSVNLSKQSTGLSYPSFFDWPKTIEQTLAADKAIKLVVIFLGPNDPWDFPNPAKHYVYLKFKSPEWEAVYKSRIERIIAAAKKHDVSIIWLGIPFMKANKLNTQTRYIDTLIKTTVGNRVIYLPTDNLLSQGKNGYVDSIKLDNKVVRVRTKDGIHFSIPGAKYLGDYVLQHILYQ
ncbi:SGNH/GDSL hydrolase family protein [Lonepinella sp. BR2474]|uniref:SGNH/GDSL hydrolase family protein n=1 Tax=Lonepinella sp. BR2474 TaxID=3434548 RepID=UPI003F6DC181